MTEQHRLILAVVLVTAILVGWQYLFPTLRQSPPLQNHSTDGATIAYNSSVGSADIAQHIPRDELIAQEYGEEHRVKIDNQFLHGSINLRGARLDDLTLAEYKENLTAGSSEVVLFSPSNTAHPYFAEFGWIQPNDGIKIELPDSKTLWSANSQILNDEQETTLSWQNSQGIKFMISFSLDKQYMFNVKQTVQNDSAHKVKLYPYSILSRSKSGSDSNNMIIHEGAIGALDNTLQELSFSDIESEKKTLYERKSGWIGFSDKYWLTAIIPSTKQIFDTSIFHFKPSNTLNERRFQIDVLAEPLLVGGGQTISSNTRLFAGAKKLDLLDGYQKQYDIPLFDRAVDFGILYFITKPIFLLLSYFHSLLGNFGLAILLLTVCIKILLFPLAYKGFVSMNKLKVLQPKMTKLKERYEGDSAALQKALLDLYKTEKVNPVSGCLPILLQMPVFFALYKVLYVTIEMRHACFFWWINDLSAPDPTNVFNLFGLIPWLPPAFLSIGVLPILMATTMYLQQNLNPAPSDPIQAKVMKFMPLFFLFMFASFPSGLVLYWAWSNILSIIQQVAIKKATE